jgi:hypothetical protein
VDSATFTKKISATNSPDTAKFKTFRCIKTMVSL